MLPALNIALSGMAAATRRLETTAANLANVDTVGSTAPGGPPAYQPLNTAQVALSGGGVATRAVPVTPGSVRVPYASSPLADSDGMVAAPNVDVIAEVTNMVLAKQGFSGAVQVAQASSDMIRRLFDLD